MFLKHYIDMMWNHSKAISTLFFFYLNRLTVQERRETAFEAPKLWMGRRLVPLDEKKDEIQNSSFTHSWFVFGCKGILQLQMLENVHTYEDIISALSTYLMWVNLDSQTLRLQWLMYCWSYFFCQKASFKQNLI